MNLSVIINTANRPEVLAKCLDSLMTQSDNNFELIVVDQSDNESTKKLVGKYELKYQKSDIKNLSLSRNLGVQLASGEVVAFLDDDAIAEEHWVARIKLAFRNDPEITCLAGRVIDGNSKQVEVQFQNGIVSEYGNIYEIRPLEGNEYERGKDGWYLRPMGTNMAFDKKALIKVGGFDEFFEYIHEETDVALRLIRAGGKNVYRNKVIVTHFQAKSHNRASKYKLNRYAEAKNNVYFGMKNGMDGLFVRTFRSMYRVWNPVGPVRAVYKLWWNGKISLLEVVRAWIGIDRGITKGWFAGTFQKRRLHEFAKVEAEFVRFKLIS